MHYPFAKPGTEDNPVVVMLEIVSWGFLHAYLRSGNFIHERFGLMFTNTDEEQKARRDAFWGRGWPLLEGSQQEELRRTFREIDEALLSPFEAWIDDIRAKMGIPIVAGNGRKMKRSPGGIEGFLRALKKDLKGKGV